jgi:hypothetical protein
MDDVFLSAIYCDDIRSEVGSKQSYMGVYNSELIVHEFPLSLPRFFIQATIRMPLKTSAESLKFQVLLDETIASELPLPDGQLQAMRAAIEEKSVETDSWLGLGVAFQFQGLNFAQPAKMTVQAVIDGEVIKGNALKIMQGERSINEGLGFALASTE